MRLLLILYGLSRHYLLAPLRLLAFIPTLRSGKKTDEDDWLKSTPTLLTRFTSVQPCHPVTIQGELVVGNPLRWHADVPSGPPKQPPPTVWHDQTAFTYATGLVKSDRGFNIARTLVPNKVALFRFWHREGGNNVLSQWISQGPIAIIRSVWNQRRQSRVSYPQPPSSPPTRKLKRYYKHCFTVSHTTSHLLRESVQSPSAPLSWKQFFGTENDLVQLQLMLSSLQRLKVQMWN